MTKQAKKEQEVPQEEKAPLVEATTAALRSEQFPDGVDGFDVRLIFSQLTQETTPHGFEWKQFDNLMEGLGFTLDKSANYQGLIKKPDGEMPETIFIAHLDTVGSVPPKRIEQRIRGDYMLTDGKTLLGADDKAGVTVLLYLLHMQVPGFYVFTYGEESGRIGSRALTMKYKFDHFKRAIAFDRRGTTSIITRQSGQTSCSDEFADALADQYADLGVILEKDTGGSFTDTVSFFGEVPECTNISVGYENAHGSNEFQNLAYLERLCHASARVDWEALPTVQDPSKRYGGSYASGKAGGADYGHFYRGAGEYTVDDYGAHHYSSGKNWRNASAAKPPTPSKLPSESWDEWTARVNQGKASGATTPPPSSATTTVKPAKPASNAKPTAALSAPKPEPEERSDEKAQAELATGFYEDPNDLKKAQAEWDELVMQYERGQATDSDVESFVYSWPEFASAAFADALKELSWDKVLNYEIRRPR